MQDLQALYQSKCGTPDELAQFVKSGDVCASDIALSNSAEIYEAIGRRIQAGDLHNVTQHTMLDTAPYPFYRPEFAEEYHGVSWFSQGPARSAVGAGRADVMPAFYRNFPRIFREDMKADVFIGVVSPMDRHGYFSTGCSGSVSEAILSGAKTILLEVNPQMPRALTAPQIHISQVTALWEHDAPLFTLPPVEIDETSTQIGGYIAEEIPDGATIQLGVGTIPDAVGMALRSKHHLGIHTEMLTDSMIELLECGAADNSCKPIHRGKTVAAFAVGSRKMYDYIDDNPAVEIRVVDYVNDPAVICQHPNFVSVNAGLQVDFYGQVCAESFGYRHYSGTGGQTDYAQGAVRSEGGKSFIAFPSTAKGGEVSRIVPFLTPGAQVSTSKNDVDNIVTEFGVARLRGRTLSQRTKALIAIAHPKFREELTFAAKKQNIII